MGSNHPYYRRVRPQAQIETDFTRDMGLRWLVGRLRAANRLPAGNGFSVRALMQTFPPSPPGSVRSLVSKMLVVAGVSPHVDLMHAHLEPYDVAEPVAEASRLFDKRAAAAVSGTVSIQLGVRVFPNVKWMPLKIVGLPLGPNWPFHVDDNTAAVSDTPGQNLFSVLDLLEMKFYGDAAPTVYIATVKCLAALAYLDYFPDAQAGNLRDLVSQALVAAGPGWCGTFGPGVGSTDLVLKKHLLEGNYDMSLMHLIPIAYRYFDEISPAAREHLITILLARGRVHRIDLNDTFTSGGAPNDWSRAGFVSPLGLHKRLGETENHILMINTARYLANQLLYQRHQTLQYDNRRNGFDGAPSCTALILGLLRNILRDDFSEYNAKSYQHETRTALLNLCSYAYDHEVRLAARMVLDYVAAHMAVSSNDGRRMVPFRRRNEGKNVAHTAEGAMTVGLLEIVARRRSHDGTHGYSVRGDQGVRVPLREPAEPGSAPRMEHRKRRRRFHSGDAERLPPSCPDPRSVRQ